MVKLEKVGTKFKQTAEKQGLSLPLYLMRTELLLLQISVKAKNIMRFLSRTLKWNEQNMRKKLPQRILDEMNQKNENDRPF